MAVLFKGPKRPKRKSTEDPEDFRLTLVEHLEELRDRIIRSLIILALAWGVGWVLVKPAYEVTTERMSKAIVAVLHKPYTEAFFHGPDPFILKVKLSFYIGLIPAFPLVLMQLWAFIEPALKPKEREPVQKIAPFSLLLFGLGSFFAWLVLPAAMSWFATYFEEFAGTSYIQEAGTLSFFVLKMMLAFGIAFQLPLIVYIMGALGVLKAETLLQYWRQAATGIFFIAMVVTPSNDPATMLMMAIPLVILFSISVYAVKVTQKKRAKTLSDPYPAVEDDLE